MQMKALDTIDEERHLTCRLPSISTGVYINRINIILYIYTILTHENASDSEGGSE